MSHWGRVAQWAKERAGAWADLLVVDGNTLENMVASLGAGSPESARGIYSPSAAVGRNGFVRGQRVPRIVRQPRARNTTSVASGERRVPDPARPRFIADPEPEFQGDLCIEN